MKAYLIKSLLSIGIIDPIQLAKSGQLLINGHRVDPFLDMNTTVYLSDTIYIHGAPLLLDKRFALPFN